MKPSILCLTTLCAFQGFALAEVSPIMLRVEQITGVNHAKFKETQEKSLKISLSNTTNADIGNLKVKYYFFGHNVKDHEAEVLDKGEKTTSVKAHDTSIVETATVKASAVEKHAEAAPKKGAKKTAKPQAKVVQPSGEKLTGYGVQVISNGSVITDYFSEPSLKDKVGGSRP